MAGEGLFKRFGEFLGRDAVRFDFVENRENFVEGSVPLFRVEESFDAEESRLPRRIAPGVDAVDEGKFLAHPPIKPAGAAVAENERKQIERGDVRVRELRDVPRDFHAGQLGGKVDVRFAPTQLRRFLRDINR